MKLLLLVLGVVGCGEVTQGPPDEVPPLPPPIDAPPSSRCAPLAPFTAPQRVIEVNTGAREESSTVRPDDLEMYINRFNTGEVFQSRRSSPAAAWSTPTLVTAFAVGTRSEAHAISADGLSIYLSVEDSAPGQLMLATRASTAAEFGAPSLLSNVNSPQGERWPSISEDDLVLHFSSSRDGSDKLYRAQRSSPAAAFEAPVVVEAPAGLYNPHVGYDGLVLHYSKQRAGTSIFDPFVSTRATQTDAFPEGTRVAALPAEASAWVTALSPDACRAYASTDGLAGAGDFEVFLLTREP